MFIGKWNKSIVVTYLGVAISIIGMYLTMIGNINYALACLIGAGVCDLFDGKFARMCKRTEEEKKFGVQLDSFADVVSFVIFPIIIFLSMGYTKWWNIIIYLMFAICGIQRLSYFNINTADENKSVDYYIGFPVTYTALILPMVYLLSYICNSQVFEIIYSLTLVLIAFLNVLNIKNKKPAGIWYLIFSVLAIIVILLYTVIL